MCGIAGLLQKRSGPPMGELAGRMIDSLSHRGPDDQGVYADEQVALGHARLSIIDLHAGKQPMTNEDGTIWVVFNGEIFNYVELREDLRRRGHHFATESDTEVLVHAYEEHGLSFVEALNGQFAFALWDRRRRRLVLCRDRVGIRPLFYTEDKDRLLFASEIKALLQVPEVPRALDLHALAQVFTFWAPLPPRTLFTGISSVPPGHLLCIEDGQHTLRRYWDWRFPEHPDEEDAREEGELIEDLRALLRDAVRLQLRADVPVGAYLSGGLDSSLITALAKAQTGAAPRTFSIRFPDPEFDEGPFQKEAAAFLGTDHSEALCPPADLCAAFPRTIWHAESTILRTAPTPLLLLSGRVRAAGYKVVLTGEGADEIFCGYDLFKEAQVRRFWARQPSSRFRPAILSRLYPYLSRSPTAAPAFAESFFRQGLEHVDAPWFGHLPRWTTTRRALRFLHPEVARVVASMDPAAEIAPHLPPSIGRLRPLCRDQYIEAHTLLSGYLLCSQGDRMAMAHGVEGRFPFLDHRVIEFGNRLPPGRKLLGLREKHLLKRAAQGLVPQSIARRPKQPYRAPDSASFFTDGKPASYVAELFDPAHLCRRGYFDPKATALLFEKCRAGRATGFPDNMAFVGILSTMLLDHLFLNAWPPGHKV